MGIGTTAVACINTNRRYIGSEIKTDTYNMGLDRIKEMGYDRKNMGQRSVLILPT